MILKSHLPILPIRPFRVFLFGFLHLLAVSMSIVSNISTAFFFDCNTFATPTDSTDAIVESLNNKKRVITLPNLTIEFLARTD